MKNLKYWYYENVLWKVYEKLSHKIEKTIPEKYHPHIEILPTPVKDKESNEKMDWVSFYVYIPHSITKKLMWYFRIWRK